MEFISRHLSNVLNSIIFFCFLDVYEILPYYDKFTEATTLWSHSSNIENYLEIEHSTWTNISYQIFGNQYILYTRWTEPKLNFVLK